MVDYAPVRPFPLHRTSCQSCQTAVRLFAPRTADLRNCANPIFPRPSPGHAQNTDAGDPPFVSAAYSTTTPRHTPTLLQFAPTRQVRSRDGTGPITPGKKTRYRARYRAREQTQMQNVSPSARRTKAKSDAPFVLSLFCILSLYTENQHASPQIEDGSARETRSRLAFPPALPPQPPDVGALRDGVVLG